MRRSAMPQTRATGLPYSGHKYITGEMRERFCANPADTGRRQAKRRLTLGDGGLSVRNPTLGDGGLPVRNPTLGDGGPSFRERSMNHPLKYRTPPRGIRLARPIGLQRACTTYAFAPHSPTFTGIMQRYSGGTSIKTAPISYNKHNWFTGWQRFAINPFAKPARDKRNGVPPCYAPTAQPRTSLMRNSAATAERP